MASYNPPVVITNNASPVLSADLMYEEHGKCGSSHTIENNRVLDANIFDAHALLTLTKAWKIVFLTETLVIDFQADNMATADFEKLGTALRPKKYAAGVEIMADITYVKVDDRHATGCAILYSDCTQS
jgi:hypothetical protein